MDGKNQFKLKDEYGNETVYDVLFTFDNEETKEFFKHIINFFKAKN